MHYFANTETFQQLVVEKGLKKRPKKKTTCEIQQNIFLFHLQGLTVGEDPFHL